MFFLTVYLGGSSTEHDETTQSYDFSHPKKLCILHSELCIN